MAPLPCAAFPTPPSLVAPKARELPDGRIFHIATFGQGNMPSHAAQIEPEDRWKAVMWVRQLQAAAPPLTEEPADGVVEVEIVTAGEGDTGRCFGFRPGGRR